MTVPYTGRVANANLCVFSRLLLCWKGSIYKLMYKEMLIFCFLYTLICLVYRLALNDEQKRWFEKLSLYCDRFTNLIPLSFVLGFYVAMIVGRWWTQFMAIPWHDRVMLYIATMIDGTDDMSRIIRRNLMRYLTLGSLIVFQATSVRIKKRFPTMDHLLEAGVITKTEVKMMDEVNTPHGKWWLPFVWSCNLIREARRQGRIADSYLMKTLIDEINTYRGNLGMLYGYDWVNVPLVYTQVTTLAVYTFFVGSLFGRQFLDTAQNYEGHNVDLYVPFFTLLQFFFYFGWLKVAEQLINPFGEDDDDFEMNWIIDRNNQISLLVADDLYGQIPPFEKDLYFGQPPPDYLPYTKSSVKSMTLPHKGSTADLRISDEGMKILSPLETIQEGVAFGNSSQDQLCYTNTPRRSFSSNVNASGYGGRRLRVNNNVPRSPSDLPSPAVSRVSLESSQDDGIQFDALSQLNDKASTPAVSSSVVNRISEKLGRWLLQHSTSQCPDVDQCSSSGWNARGPISRQTSDTEQPTTSAVPIAIPTRDGAPGPNCNSQAVRQNPRLPPLVEVFHRKSSLASGGPVTNSLATEMDPPDRRHEGFQLQVPRRRFQSLTISRRDISPSSTLPVGSTPEVESSFFGSRPEGTKSTGTKSVSFTPDRQPTTATENQLSAAEPDNQPEVHGGNAAAAVASATSSGRFLPVPESTPLLESVHESTFESSFRSCDTSNDRLEADTRSTASPTPLLLTGSSK